MLGGSAPSPFLGGFTPTPLHQGLHPQAPDGFGLNLSSQLVIGYHWLASLNSQFTTHVERKIGHISKTKKSISEYCASFGTIFLSSPLYKFLT